MLPIPEIALNGGLTWGAGGRPRWNDSRAHATSGAPTLRFSPLRWVFVFGFAAIFSISMALAAIMSYFMKAEILNNDAVLTSQFVASLAAMQSGRASLGANVTLGQILDEREDLPKLGVDLDMAQAVRIHFYHHLRVLQDVLLANVIAPDRRVIWSTNPVLVGTTEQESGKLLDAFAARGQATLTYVDGVPTAVEEQFVRQPERLYVESYIPLHDMRGNVVAVAKLYREPTSMLRTDRLGIVWACIGIALAAVFLFAALFWIVGRANRMLRAQQQRLVEAEALCLVGEMSAAVAHGIRSPLASIRSSAELALDGDLDGARKNATDIMVQVDRLGNWVRELLQFSRPLAGESQRLDLAALAEECLAGFAVAFEQNRIACDFVPPPPGLPLAIGNEALTSLALGNIVANAVEAMPGGGSLRVEFKYAAPAQGVQLIVSDTGRGIAAAELERVFKPCYTTKRNGLGLGMALAKRIMERFDGAIDLHSRQGEGTCVSLRFQVV